VEFFKSCKTLGDWAVAYRKLGWCVIPLVPGSRASYLHKWTPYQTALPTINQIRAWWRMWPDASIGIVLGPISGLLVIDTDSEEADELFRKLAGDVAERCPAAMSGSRKPGRYHYYFRHPELPTSARNVDIHQKLEIRGTNGLIIADPSLHNSGNTYSWIDQQAIWEVPLLETPPAIIEALNVAEDRKTHRPSVERVTIVGTGGFSSDFEVWNGAKVPGDVAEFLRGEHAHTDNWNNNLFRCARWCRDHHMPLEEAEQRLVLGADPTSSADRDNALRTIRSAYAYQP
jgi:hypothetical protein